MFQLNKILFSILILLFLQPGLHAHNHNDSLLFAITRHSGNDSIDKNKNRHSAEYLNGMQDARENYNDNSAFAIAFASSLLLPPVGLITTIAISTSEPKTKKLNVPNEKLLTNEDYMNGYIKKAKKIKAGKAWSGCLTGLAFFGIAIFMLY